MDRMNVSHFPFGKHFFIVTFTDLFVHVFVACEMPCRQPCMAGGTCSLVMVVQNPHPLLISIPSSARATPQLITNRMKRLCVSISYSPYWSHFVLTMICSHWLKRTALAEGQVARSVSARSAVLPSS